MGLGELDELGKLDELGGPKVGLGGPSEPK